MVKILIQIYESNTENVFLNYYYIKIIIIIALILIELKY